MKITKTLVQISDDGMLLACDTIEYEGKLWLVPDWLTGPVENSERPARIICVHGIPMNPKSLNYAGRADRELLIRLSRETLAGGTGQGLVVIEEPDIIHYGGKNLN